MYRNRDYSDFWNNQSRLQENYKKMQYEQNERDKELERERNARYRGEIIDDMKRKVKEEEAASGHSGNFFKDFKYGVKEANKTVMRPFNKYVAPVLSMTGPIGSAISSSTRAVSGVVDKLE